MTVSYIINYTDGTSEALKDVSCYSNLYSSKFNSTYNKFLNIKTIRDFSYQEIKDYNFTVLQFCRLFKERLGQYFPESAEELHTHGMTLSAEYPFAFILGLFSIYRKLWEEPYLIIQTVNLINKYNLSFDSALVLAHLTHEENSNHSFVYTYIIPPAMVPYCVKNLEDTIKTQIPLNKVSAWLVRPGLHSLTANVPPTSYDYYHTSDNMALYHSSIYYLYRGKEGTVEDRELALEKIIEAVKQ